MTDVEYPINRVAEVIQRAQFTAQVTRGEEQHTARGIVALLQVQLQNVRPGEHTVFINEDLARELDRVLG